MTFLPATSPDTDAVTFHEFSVAPEAIPLPGEAHLNINLTFHRVIEHAYVDIEIYKMVFGLPLKVPCLNESIILGSWYMFLYLVDYFFKIPV